MTNWEDVWGKPNKNWTKISFQDRHIMTVLMVVAWISMVASIFFGVYTLLSKSEVSGVLMVFCLIVWMGSGISYIRIRRSKRRFITVIQ